MRHPLVDRIIKEMNLAVSIHGELALDENGADEICSVKEFDEILAELKKLPAKEAIDILRESREIKYGDYFVEAINLVLGGEEIEIDDPWSDEVFEATEDMLYYEEN